VRDYYPTFHALPAGSQIRNLMAACRQGGEAVGNVNDIVRLVGLFQVGSGCARYPRKITWTHPNEGAFIPFSFFSFPLRAEKDIGSSFKP
jgi:hypothetical protein